MMSAKFTFGTAIQFINSENRLSVLIRFALDFFYFFNILHFLILFFIVLLLALYFYFYL